MDPNEIRARFLSVEIRTERQARSMDLARTLYAELALEVVDHTPPGREQSLAITALEDSLHWALQALVRDAWA